MKEDLAAERAKRRDLQAKLDEVTAAGSDTAKTIEKLQADLSAATQTLAGYQAQEKRSATLEKVLSADKFKGLQVDRDKVGKLLSKVAFNEDTLEADIEEVVAAVAVKPVGSSLDPGGVGDTQKALSKKNSDLEDKDPFKAMFVKAGAIGG